MSRSVRPFSSAESDQAYACLHADLLAVHFRLQLAVGLLDQREEADQKLARVARKAGLDTEYLIRAFSQAHRRSYLVLMRILVLSMRPRWSV
jgi:DNA-binding phage protein